jgi:hypothetical protein
LTPQLHPADIELRMLIEAVYLRYNYDFRDYTGASQKRRVLHALGEMDCASISALQARCDGSRDNAMPKYSATRAFALRNTVLNIRRWFRRPARRNDRWPSTLLGTRSALPINPAS